MIIAVDWDGTVVEQDGRAYVDVTTPEVFRPGAKEALRALRAAGHTLLLYSARANRALRVDPNLDPLVRAGAKRIHLKAWEANRGVNAARYQQMITTVARELPGVFAAVDDGLAGKPAGCQLFLDDRALTMGGAGLTWAQVAERYGAEPDDTRSLVG